MSETDNANHHGYTSNPFLAVLKGLVKVLNVNPISILLVAVLPIILIVLGGIVSTILGTAFLEHETVGAIVSIAAGVFIILVLIRAVVGAVYILKASREDRMVKASDAMKKYASPYVLRTIGIALVSIASVAAIILAGVLIGNLLGDASSMVAIVSVTIIASVYLMVRWSLSLLVLVNENTTVIKSLKRSFYLTSGHFVEMLGVIIAQTLTSSNGLLSVATSVSGLDTRYREIKAYKDAKATKPDVSWVNWLLVGLLTLVIVAYVSFIFLLGYSLNGLNKKSSSSSSNSAATYCYFDKDFQYNCSTKDACLQNSDCNDYYHLESSDTLFNTDTNSGYQTD